MYSSVAYTCTYSIKGFVLDEHDQSGLALSNIFVMEKNSYVTCDELGYFEIENLCEQTYTLIISHMGCEPDTIALDIKKSIVINFYLEHHAILLEEIKATSKKMNEEFAVMLKLKQIDFTNNQGKDLASILSNINGVNILKTGTSISKPVVHGFFNDRVVLVYNGVPFNTQDWGNDHAPEIDANVISRAEIVNNASYVLHTTQNSGATIQLESDNLWLQKHRKMGIFSTFQTNNLFTSLNTFWEEGFAKPYSFRVQMSYKKAADSYAPNYILSNTANQEMGLSLLQKFKLNDRIISTVNYNFINQDIGILRASHIGNIDDLNKAIESEKPLILLPRSFSINNPRQNIVHHQADVKLNYTLQKKDFLQLRVNIQNNRRKEFDIRRGGRSNIPALDMHLLSVFGNILYNKEKYILSKKEWLWATKSGVNYQYKNNTNNAETGVLPLIPDYLQHHIAVNSFNEFSKKNIKVDVGIRYEYNYMLAFTFDKKNNIVYNKYNFNAYSISSNIYFAHKLINMQTGLSLASKLPNINELHSNGLHHSTASIEIGNNNLKLEKAFQWNTILQYNFKKYLQIEAFYRLQYIKDYIFLAPDSLPTLTIRGAFPTFNYNATNAFVQNISLQAQSTFTSFASLIFQYNLVRAKDVNTNDYIIFMPADRLNTSIRFFKDFKKRASSYIEFGYQYVLKQKRTPQKIKDYKEVPNRYGLFNAKIGSDINLKSNHKLHISVQFENILNQSYRDYLNRLRYFADEIGFNSTIRIQYFFN